jgi:transcriptional regulator with XRE-family HTH domain
MCKAKAIFLREHRKLLGLSPDDIADILDVWDVKLVSAIERGFRSITMEKAARLALHFGHCTVEIPGGKRVLVVPYREDRPPMTVTHRPAEAALIALEELNEADNSLKRLQHAIQECNHQMLVEIYEQAVCDPAHAIELLKTTIRQYDPSVPEEAERRHKEKLEKKGVYV